MPNRKQYSINKTSVGHQSGVYPFWIFFLHLCANKASLMDLIAATGLVISLKFDSNCRFFSPCDLEIWWMTSKNYRASLLQYVNLCASSQIHRWIQTGVTVRKPSIPVQICDFLSRVTLKFARWPWKTIGHLFYVASGFVHHFITILWILTKVTVRKPSIRVKIVDFFCLVWPWNLMNDLEKQ